MNGKIAEEGAAEDRCSTLAWLANNLAERGRDLNAGGMVVITGILIPTVSITGGQRVVITVNELGETIVDAL